MEDNLKVTFNPSYTGLRRDLIKNITGQENIVLDLGCADGANGDYLLNSGIAKMVYGVEFDAEMATESGKKYTKIYHGDLDDQKFLKSIINDLPALDYILMGDVLEHLYDPLLILNNLKPKLKEGGEIIISLPNIAHIELFIQVYIKGRWPRNQRGIFDQTHIRWFTRKDAFDLVENAGLKIVRYERKLRARDEMGASFDWKYKILKYLNRDWVTFQHIIVCTNA